MKRLLLPLILLLASFPLLGADFEIKPGEHVLFYGDSITQQKLYTSFAETYVLTRFPTLNATFTNSGWGGDRVTGGHGGDIGTRLKRDLFPFKPDVVTIMLGMNDGRYRAYDEEIFETYSKGLADIVSNIRSQLPAARITLIKPSPYDDVTRAPRFEGGYNKVLVTYGKYVGELAKKNNALCADLNTAVVAALEKAKRTNRAVSETIIKDRVHPGPGGQILMAAELLKTWNAPALVTDVRIDASKPAARIANTELAALKIFADGALTWTQLDKALPFPINFNDAAVALAVQSSDFVQKLNLQMLRVDKLPSSHYELSIDGEVVDIFTREQLEAGVNLAILPTPMTAQAAQVHELTVQHNDMRFRVWRQVQIPFADVAGMDKALDEIRKAEMALVEVQRQLARPVLRKYSLKPVEAGKAQGRTVVGSQRAAPPATMNPLNLALGRPYVSSDKNMSGIWGVPTPLTDGSWETKAGSTFATGYKNEFPKTVTVDLQATQPIACVIIGVPPFGSTKTVVVSLSTDGKKFQKAGEYTFLQKQEQKRIMTFGTQSARYIRLTYPDKYDERVGYDISFMFTTELEAYAPQGAAIAEVPANAKREGPAQAVVKLPANVNPKNLALNKPYVTSDKNVHEKWGTPTALTDGSWETKAGSTFATGYTNEFPKTVTVDLQATQPISCVIIGVPPFGSTKTIEVSLSTNGKKFQKVAEHTFLQKQEQKQVLAFGTQSARYVRLTYPNKYNERVGYDISFMFTTELEAYAPQGAAIADVPANAKKEDSVQAVTKLPANVNPKNLALNKPYVSSDKNMNAIWGVPTPLTDGSWEGKAGSTFATGAKDEFPKTVTIDLGSEQKLACVVAGVPKFGSTKTVKISLSTNGKKFSEVGSYRFTLKKEERHVYSFKAQSARYIRLTYPDKYDEKAGFPSTFMFTTEVEAYGPKE